MTGNAGLPADVNSVMDLIEEKLCIVWTPHKREQFVELLRAALRQPAGVKVRGLEWGAEGDPDVCHCLVGGYAITDSGTLIGYFPDRKNLGNHETVEGARAAAQADYERRITSALEPAALSKQEAETEAWSRLRRVSDIAHNAATADRLPSSTARQVLADIVALSECYGAYPVPAEPSGWRTMDSAPKDVDEALRGLLGKTHMTNLPDQIYAHEGDRRMAYVRSDLVAQEHASNETGNPGKGLPNDPENVPENENIRVSSLPGTSWRSIDTAPEDQHVILCTSGGHVGEAIMLIDEDTGQQKWAWALGPLHPNLAPYGWQPLPEALNAPVASDLRPGGFDGPTGAE